MTTSEVNQEIARVMGQLQKLRHFSNNPDDYLPGVKNPKIEYLKNYVDKALRKSDGKAKTVTFTDNPELAMKTGEQLSKRFPSQRHVVALADEIRVYDNGEIVEKFNRSSVLKDRQGNVAPKDQWQTHAIRMLGEENIATFNLTKAYTTGHNMQFAQNVVHLDRDTWNYQNMAQREARVWRTGQLNPVDVKILDLTIDDGSSINEIEKYSMEIERKLFDEVVRKSENIEFDEEDPVADIKKLLANKEALEFEISPSVSNLGKTANTTPYITPTKEEQLQFIPEEEEDDTVEEK